VVCCHPESIDEALSKLVLGRRHSL
jgi:hypothetical protein